MSRYELSISPSYVPDWGIVEAARELFQNAIDQEFLDPTNKMVINYDNKILSISSELSRLSKSSLLLGTTTKRDNTNTIGKFGEGYKLALLVFTRLGYKVEVLNYSSKEKWVPKIIKSRRYDSDLLVIDVEKYIFKRVPNSSLTINIEGVSLDDYEQIKSKTLFLQDSVNTIESVDCEILTDPDKKGEVYVNGLYVCKCEEKGIEFGYNVKPNMLKLDRDRSIVDSFNLLWMTSQLWASHTDKDFVADLVSRNVKDVKYLNIHAHSKDTINDKLFERFQLNHGLSSVPVSNEGQKRIIRKSNPRLKTVITDENQCVLISRSSGYKDLLTTSKTIIISPYSHLREFQSKYKDIFTEEMNNDFLKLLDKSREWIK